MEIDIEVLQSQARKILQANWTGEFTKPAPSLYPHQWNWDSGFIALGYATYDLDRAEAELRSLFKGQWGNGMLPHIVFRPDPAARYFPGPDFWQTESADFSPSPMLTSGITQPPVHGLIVEMMLEYYSDNARALGFVEEMFPQLLSLHQYFYRFRDPGQEGLVSILHPWESGTDNAPAWDGPLQAIDIDPELLPSYSRKDLQSENARAHRPTDDDYDRYVYLVDVFRRHRYDEHEIQKHCPFQIQDPMFNAILARSNESIFKLYQLLKGEGRTKASWEIEVTELKEKHALTQSAMNKKLWNEHLGTYDVWDVWQDRRIPMHGHSCFVPLLCGCPDEDRVGEMLKRLQGPGFSGGEGGHWWIGSYDRQEPAFNPEKYWRGPVWINTNWLIAEGLKRNREHKLARKIRQDSLELLQNQGFYEYFHPLRSANPRKGCGTHDFSWSAALCLHWLKQS